MLEQTFYASQIVAAVCVVVSIIFLILEVRSNTRSQRVVAVVSLSDAIARINVPPMESPALGAAIAKATRDWWSAGREERILAHFFLYSFFKLHENAWYQYQAGVLERSQWEGWETQIRLYYHSPGVQQVWWPKRCNAYSKAFQAYLAQTKAPLDIATLSDLFDDPPRAPPKA